MKQYRIKTEAEFIEEFGEDWREKIRYVWVDEMNYLYGFELMSGEEHCLDDYFISEDMITDKPLPEESESEESVSDRPSTNKYHRTIHDINGIKMDGLIDVYSVIQAFNISNPAQQHLVKKALCAGLRGKGDFEQDMTECHQAIDRAISLNRKGE